MKKNGQPQPPSYIEGIVNTIQTSAFARGETAPLCPFWHFNTRKAVEMWTKEVYRETEMYPLNRRLPFGPLTEGGKKTTFTIHNQQLIWKYKNVKYKNVECEI